MALCCFWDSCRLSIFEGNWQFGGRVLFPKMKNRERDVFVPEEVPDLCPTKQIYVLLSFLGVGNNVCKPFCLMTNFVQYQSNASPIVLH